MLFWHEANENAETFGSLDCGISILIAGVGAGIVGATTITSLFLSCCRNWINCSFYINF
jgi:hypothetical protein